MWEFIHVLMLKSNCEVLNSDLFTVNVHFGYTFIAIVLLDAGWLVTCHGNVNTGDLSACCKR